ncbi:MAG: tRNA (guanosine(37)-N1)-methyltransferase TrmD [Clostridiales bacterium]|nr:tRNA (guanosine(37)-N1)-methyltransferase TrmD [Clostridiales bacterium]
MKIDVFTLFPEMFGPVVTDSILGRANESGLVEVKVHNIRDYTTDKHNKTDDYPFGGGAGMVMYAEPISAALEANEAQGKKIIYMSPRGKILTHKKVLELASGEDLVILCGHYEGVDERALEYWDMEEISIGDYILTGGELPAMVLIDSVARFIPGVLGNSEAHTEESICSGLIEYPQYTKPREWRDMPVPEVLLSGHHENIHLWQLENSLRLTKERRPDLFEAYIKERSSTLSKKEKKILDKILNEWE